MKQKIISVLVLLMAQLLAFQSAQAFPDRPVKLVVPSPAGGPPDIMARLLSDKMGAALGQPVIVENRAGGAGGTIGAKSVIAAEPDGHAADGQHKRAPHSAFDPQECRLQLGNIRTCCRSFGNHRSPGRASVRTGQLRRRVGQIGEVAAAYAEVRLGRGWLASTS